MKKILFVHPLNDYTGSSIMMGCIIEEYLSKGYEISIVTSALDGGALDKYRGLIRFHIAGPCYFGGRKVKYLSYLFTKIHAFLLVLWYGFFHDHIYINTIMPYYASIASFFNRCKVTYHIHEKFILYDVSRHIAEFVFNHTRANRIFVSNYLLSVYPQRLDSPAIVKYNTLSASFLSQVTPKPIKERKRNTCTMICSLNASKGIFSYVDLAKSLPDLDFNLILSASSDAINRFLNISIPKNLRVYPKQISVHSFLYDTDLLFSMTIPSMSIETFGMTILEAMAYGIPAIVPNIGGPIELVRHGYNGYTVDVTNINELRHYTIQALDMNNYDTLAINSYSQLLNFVEQYRINYQFE